MKKSILDVKVGQKVIRYISSARIPMPMLVTAVDETLIYCGDWTFDRRTGAEIDEALGWTGTPDASGFINTGSVLEIPPL